MDFYHDILRDTDALVRRFLSRQITDPKSPDCGAMDCGYVNPYPDPKYTSHCVCDGIACYVNPESGYYRSAALREAILSGIGYLSRKQRPSGNYDLENCNFDSAPDTAFILHRQLPALRLLRRGGTPDAGLEQALTAVISAAADGVCGGGFHTPNHRWAIASCLYECGRELARPQYLARADQYLAEGIDCNEDGEYSERSINYNVVNNAAMIRLFHETGDLKYLEYVQRNLHMMLYYMEPDGTFFSENSLRQDKGRRMYPDGYFIQCLTAAVYLQDEALEAMAHRILTDNNAFGRPAPDCLPELMLDEKLRAAALKAWGYLESYDRYFKKSGIARHRGEGFTYALIQNNNKFFCFSGETIDLYIKVGVGFFEQRYMRVQEIEPTPEGYRLSYHADGWYYQPFQDAKGDIENFFEAPNARREKIYPNALDVVIVVRNLDRGLEMRIRAAGINGVALRFEIGLPAGCTVETPALLCGAPAGGGLMVKEGMVTVTRGGEAVRFGPAFADRIVRGGNYGSDPQSAEHFTVTCVGVTEFERAFTVERVR